MLALQGDVTRVITFQLARETSNRTYPEIGVSDPHHPLTHHGNDPEKIAKMAKINAFHVSLFADFLAKAESHAGRRRHAARSFALSVRQRHGQSRRPRPRESADPRRRRRGGRMKGGRHIRYNEPTPLANLHLTLLDKVGVQLDSFADSTGKIPELASL